MHINIPYNPATYTADGDGSWDVLADHQTNLSYTFLSADTVLVDFTVIGSSVEGHPMNLFIALPQGLVCARRISFDIHAANRYQEVPGLGYIMRGGTVIGLQRPQLDANAVQPAWEPSEYTNVGGQVLFEVMR